MIACQPYAMVVDYGLAVCGFDQLAKETAELFSDSIASEPCIFLRCVDSRFILRKIGHDRRVCGQCRDQMIVDAEVNQSIAKRWNAP